MTTNEITVEVAVLGSGPGGYSAAFRAADLGKTVALIERYENIGGVCLNVGCIPSKTYLHAAKVLDEAREMSAHGIEFYAPTIDTTKLRDWKNKVVSRLTTGLKNLAKHRQVQIVHGIGKFISPKQIEVDTPNGKQIVTFDNAIIAAGSQNTCPAFLPKDDRIMDSSTALELEHTKGDLLIIGSGIIGLEMATVYHAFGADITVAVSRDQIIQNADKDIVLPLERRLKRKYKKLLYETRVANVEAKEDGLYVTFTGKHASEEPQRFDYILSAMGRRPNGNLIGAENAGVNINEKGFIPVDKQLRTNVPHIFAIGDIVGQPMLAHKAVPEGRTAAEVIAGLNSKFDPNSIPSVAYTDPEIAWTGLTEKKAIAQGINYKKGVFPWAACGRSLSQGRNEGLTKIIFEPKSEKILGAAITGPNAGELIAETTLAIEKECTLADIAKTIHPHPTLSETIMMAAEVCEGTVTDIYIPKQKS